jgi:hypothetical protein
MRAILLPLLALSCASVFAQDNFPKIPEPDRGHVQFRALSGRDALDHLIRIKVIEVPGFLTFPQRSSRYDTAVLVHKGWIRLRTIIDYLEGRRLEGKRDFKSVEPFQKELATASEELASLSDEYSRELLDLGADRAEMRTELAAFRSRFRKSLTSRYAASVTRTELSESTKAVMAEGKRWGLAAGYPDGLIYHARPDTRKDLAKFLTYVADSLDQVAAMMTRDAGSASEQATALRTWFRILGRLDIDLLRLVDESYFELAQLGLEPERIAARIDDSFFAVRTLTGQRIVAPLVDVPHGHWGERAIAELQGAGVLIGYPDGRFGG